MIICPNCSQENEGGSKFCITCGADLSSKSKSEIKNNATRVCEQCAKSVSQQALQCPHCRRWREDIEKDRMAHNVWVIVPIAYLGFFFFIFIGIFFSGILSGCPWRRILEKVFSVPGIYLFIGISIIGISIVSICMTSRHATRMIKKGVTKQWWFY